MSPADDPTRDYRGSTAQQQLSLLIYHRDGAQIVPLDETNKVVVIGRSPPSQVQIDDDSLSRQHARVTLIYGELWIEDLGSTNGTFINGARITNVRINPGDEVTMGALTLSLHTPGQNDPQSEFDLDSHDGLVRSLEHEVARAKTFQRSLALVMARGDCHVTRWLPKVQARLRSVDRMAVYSPDTLLVLVPEVNAEQALQHARELAAATEPSLRLGVAYYPSSAASGGALLEAARGAARRATAREPVRFVGGFAKADEADPTAPVVASQAMKRVYETVRKVARAHLPVLIVGETGTGKEIVARALHQHSPRGGGPLRCINSAAIPVNLIESVLFGHERGAFTGAERRQKGVFEEASGGTVFLDEVGELSPAAQAALLRVLETKQLNRVGSHDLIDVDVRVVAATHRDLEAMCGEGTFRQDLLFRLNAVTITVPPLRERPEEVAAFAEHFLGQSASISGGGGARSISQEALELMQAYVWPGNVRELRNAIERAAVISVGETITVEDLPERVREGGTSRHQGGMSPGGQPAEDGPGADPSSFDLRGQIRALEIRLIRQALSNTAWNQTEAAALLGIPRRTLVRRLSEYGIRRDS